jgi:predicted Fe-Mo cluster-binding NifX family protein
MKICVPVMNDQGLKSQICAHFGSAPMFLVVDTAQKTAEAIPNGNQHHTHGMCNPLGAIQGRGIDVIIVGGIGAGAVQKFRMACIEVFRTDLPIVEQAISAYEAGQLQPVSLQNACAHHGGPCH